MVKLAVEKKIFLLALTILLIAIFWRFSEIFTFPDSSIVLQKGELIKIRAGEKITQKFSAQKDGLAKIEILLRSPGIRFEKGDRVQVKLLDENCQKEIREGFLEDAFLDSNNLYEFNFPRISDSAGRNFCLFISPDKENSKSIKIFTMGDEKGQPLSIRPAHKNAHFWQNLSELNKRISQYKPWFLKHYFLYFIAFSFLLLSLGLVLIFIFF